MVSLTEAARGIRGTTDAVPEEEPSGHSELAPSLGTISSRLQKSSIDVLVFHVRLCMLSLAVRCRSLYSGRTQVLLSGNLS